MGDRSYIGITTPQGVTAHYLHCGDSPAALIPTLRAIWDGLGCDSHDLAKQLLTEDWSTLTPDRHPTSPGPFVPGIGRPSYAGTHPQPATIRLDAPIGADIEWLYVLNPDTGAFTVYEATVHDRWLRHSLHFLDPAQQRAADSGPLHPARLQVPHRDLRIVRLRPPIAPPGLIFTAAILWRGTPAGGLHRWGTPSMHVYLSDADLLTETDLRQYLNGCRLDGQPVSQAQALRALADEALLSGALEDAYSSNTTLLRQTDAYGYTQLCLIIPIPDGPVVIQQLSNWIDGQFSGHWQIWSGGDWTPLPHPEPPPA